MDLFNTMLDVGNDPNTQLFQSLIDGFQIPLVFHIQDEFKQKIQLSIPKSITIEDMKKRVRQAGHLNPKRALRFFFSGAEWKNTTKWYTEKLEYNSIIQVQLRPLELSDITTPLQQHDIPSQLQSDLSSPFNHDTSLSSKSDEKLLPSPSRILASPENFKMLYDLLALEGSKSDRIWDILKRIPVDESILNKLNATQTTLEMRELLIKKSPLQSLYNLHILNYYDQIMSIGHDQWEERLVSINLSDILFDVLIMFGELSDSSWIKYRGYEICLRILSQRPAQVTSQKLLTILPSVALNTLNSGVIDMHTKSIVEEVMKVMIENLVYGDIYGGDMYGYWEVLLIHSYEDIRILAEKTIHHQLLTNTS